jgi:hypothetical protein
MWGWRELEREKSRWREEGYKIAELVEVFLVLINI